METSLAIKFYEKQSISGNTLSVKITGDERFESDGVFDLTTIVNIMSNDVKVTSFDFKGISFWKVGVAHTAYTLLYHLIDKESVVKVTPVFEIATLRKLDEKNTNQLLINYCQLLTSSDLMMPMAIANVDRELPDEVLEAIIANKYTRKSMTGVVPYSYFNSTYLGNLSKLVTLLIQKNECRTISEIRQLKEPLAVIQDVRARDSLQVFNNESVQTALNALDKERVVKVLHKHRESKNVNEILEILIALFGDAFNWGSLDDEFMKRYFPFGVTIGSFTYQNPAVQEGGVSDLIPLLPQSFDSDPIRVMLVLLAESDPTRLNSLYVAIAKSMLYSVTYLPYTQSTPAADFLKGDYEQVLAADKDHVLQERMVASLNILVTLVTAKNTLAIYNRFENWRTYQKIDSIFKGVAYSKEIKKRSMAAKLKNK